MSDEYAEHVERYLREAQAICSQLPRKEILNLVEGLAQLRANGGRLFFIGVGGSAANASHAVNDFRKIACIESYTPTDNIAELTARINDDGWESSYQQWLLVSRLAPRDALFVLSVGGGDERRGISVNLIQALRFARERGAKIYGIVGRDGGYTAQVADACAIVPTINRAMVTPHAETFQSLILHLIVSHPVLAAKPMKWESSC